MLLHEMVPRRCRLLGQNLQAHETAFADLTVFIEEPWRGRKLSREDLWARGRDGPAGPVALRGSCDQRAEGWGVEVEGMLQAGPRLCSLSPLSSSLAQVPSPGSHLTPGCHPSQYAPVVENTPVREGPTLYKV